jgi:hypothetical protein
MRRDWDLIRRILKKIQDDDRSDLANISPEVLSEHVSMLSEAGLIECEADEGGDPIWVTARLTWEGHEFIESAEDEGLYQQAIQKAKAAGSVSFEIIKTVIAELAKRAIFGS